MLSTLQINFFRNRLKIAAIAAILFVHQLYGSAAASSTIPTDVTGKILIRAQPIEEGWDLGSDLKYLYQGKEIDFTGIHRRMNEEEDKIRDNITRKGYDHTAGNICQTRFSFIMIGENNGSSGEAEATYLNDDGNEEMLFGKHIFIAGDDISGRIYDQYIATEGYLFAIPTDQNQRMNQNLPEKAFIFPPLHNYCANFDRVANELVSLYGKRPVPGESSRVSMARNWLELRKYDHTDEKVALEIIEWFKLAQSTPLHRSNRQEGQDFTVEVKDMIAFYPGSDSEQKIRYYLNLLSSAGISGNTIFIYITAFTELLEEITKYFSQKRLYLAAQIKETLASTSKSVTKGAKLSNRALYDTERQAYDTKKKRLKEIASILQENEVIAHDFDERIKRLESDLTNFIVGHSEERNCQILELRELLARVKICLRADNQHTKFDTIIGELTKITEDFNASENRKYDKEDLFVSDFISSVTLACSKGRSIGVIVFHIHSTNDCCHSCAPDLAQELVSDTGFVNFFKKLVADKNPNKKAPSFSLVYSFRQAREFTAVSLMAAQKSPCNLIDPTNTDNPNNTKFYQHKLVISSERVAPPKPPIVIVQITDYHLLPIERTKTTTEVNETID